MMKIPATRSICVLATCCLMLLAASVAHAQNATTGILSGSVRDQSGALIPGVTVTAHHGPTGTDYSGISGDSGRYVIPYVRVGGPYTVTAALPGFKTQEKASISVSLGQDLNVDFVLSVATITETVNVTADADPVLSEAHNGPVANVSLAQIETLPSVARSIEDFARTSPFFAPSANNADPSALSIAGRSNKYNNVQIDGAVNNDLFGLAANGAPGGQTETQPISIDAIEELQLVVAPYDVRQGGFSGGGVNAITKSGTNTIHGTGYYFGRNQKLVGDSVDGRAFGKFTEKLGGASVGGAIVPNRAFYFGNFELDRKSLPSGFSVEGGEGQAFGRAAEANRILAVLKTKYSYDPGGLGQFTRAVNNSKFFVRGDVNINDKNKLTVRHNYVDGTNDIGRLSSTEFFLPDYFYTIRNKTNSTVGQLNTIFGPRMFNEFRMTYERIRDKRNGPTNFPSLEIQLGAGAGGGLFRAGRERSSTANELDQDIIELTDDFTLFRGNHTVTLGTHNEFFKFRNLFIQNSFGYYIFFDVAKFEAGLAQGYQYAYSNTNDPLLAAKFNVRQFGFYAGDQWKIARRLTLTYGLRVDDPTFPKSPTRNPVTETAFNYRTDITPKGLQWSPRVGFNYGIGNGSRKQVRGGIGLFSGRTPYVWLSNQFTGTGLEFTRITVSNNAANNIPFVADPKSQPRNLGTAAVNEANLLDPDYKYPEILRWNVGYDQTIFGLTASAEVLYTKTLNDIYYKNLNYAPNGQTRPDGRVIVGQVNRTFSNALFLTNTSKGDAWTLAFKVERPMKKGLLLSGSYLYGQSTSVHDGGSSTAFSNWRFLYVNGDPNVPVNGISNYDVRHRINTAASYRLSLPGHTGLTASMFYNIQSGRPYSATFSNDMNGDLQDNDIMFVPKSASDVIVTGGTWEELDAYISSDSAMKNHRGTIPQRNTGRSPWTNGLDARFAYDVPLHEGKSVQFTVDVQNFGNMVRNTFGVVKYANFNETSPVRFDGVDAATGKMIYNLTPMKASTFRKYETDDPRSRWQAQLGLRFKF